MQVYGLRFFNFFRFGEKDNSVVFDISPEDQVLLNNGKISLDDMYDKLVSNPITYIAEVKKRGLTNLLGIAGIMGDNYDFSNGVGKSTILEGICYAHYEKIVRRNVNTDKIATAGLSVVTKINKQYPPNMKESWVEEIFEENGRVYRIKRGRSFSSSQNSNQPILEFSCYNEGEQDSQSGHRKSDTNESIAAVTPMDYELFVNSVMFGQSDAGKFLMGTDKTRKEMLVALLRLEGVISGCLDNIRARKNSKERDIAALNAQIDILDSNLKSKEPTEVLEAQIKALQDSIKASGVQIKANNDKIEELSKSEAIKVLDGIKEEGKKVKESLLAQKEAKELQVKEWNSLYAETDKKEKLQGTKIENLVARRKEIQEQIVNLDADIKKFDLVSREEELKKVEKAKIAKPEYLTAIKKLQETKESAVAELATEKSEYNRISKEMALLKEQLDRAGNKDEFVCDKCKSKVTKNHIQSEINECQIKVDNHNGNIKALSETQVKTISDLEQKQKRLDIINDYLIRENKIKSEIKDNDNKKQKLDETKKLQSEDYSKMYEEMQFDHKSLRDQKNEYLSKSNEISKKYDSEIQKLQTNLDNLTTKFTSAKKDAEDIENRIKSLRVSIEKATQDKSQFDSQIGSLRKEIDTIQKETLKLKQLRDKNTQEASLLNRLVLLDEIFGLEGVQTRIVKKYLPLLNIYIKDVMETLTNGEMKVEIYINDKSKVDINIEGGTADNFTMISGGEKMLVRLAVDIGLALLSFTRCAQRPQLVCLDEVFDPLDSYHTQSVFKLITRLQEKFHRVIVISHKENINKIIKHQILIEKAHGIFGLSRVRSIT